MRKQLFILGILFLSVTQAKAQSDMMGFDFGVRGGVNFATLTSGDLDEAPDARTSFYAGFVAEAPLTERFSIQAEAFYSGQGFDIQSVEDGDDIEFQLDYIQVPVLLKIYLVEGLNIHAGPQFGFKISEEIDSSPLDDGGDFDTDSIKDFDFQIAAGVEYKFTGGFFVQARYAYGLTEVIDNTDTHNAVFSTGIGFMF